MRIEIDPEIINPDELLYKITDKANKLNIDGEFSCNVSVNETFIRKTINKSCFHKMKINVKYKILKPCFLILYKVHPQIAVFLRDYIYKVVRKILY